MAASRIKGITIEIGGDTTKLQTALKGVNTEIRNTHIDFEIEHIGNCCRCISSTDVSDLSENIDVHAIHLFKTIIFQNVLPKILY